MPLKIYYKNVEKPIKNHKVEVFEGDVVKILDRFVDKEKLYKIQTVNNKSQYSNYFLTCYILDLETLTEGYRKIPISELIFVNRDFEDPDHF